MRTLVSSPRIPLLLLQLMFLHLQLLLQLMFLHLQLK